MALFQSPSPLQERNMIVWRKNQVFKWFKNFQKRCCGEGDWKSV